MELADTSAWTKRYLDAAVRADFDARVLAGEVAICDVVAMELLWTARDSRQFRELREDLDALPQIPITPASWRRAIEVCELLVRGRRHRQVKQPDLLLAATAELAGVAVCHYDRDYETIA